MQFAIFLREPASGLIHLKRQNRNNFFFVNEQQRKQYKQYELHLSCIRTCKPQLEFVTIPQKSARFLFTDLIFVFIIQSTYLDPFFSPFSPLKTPSIPSPFVPVVLSFHFSVFLRICVRAYVYITLCGRPFFAFYPYSRLFFLLA